MLFIIVIRRLCHENSIDDRKKMIKLHQKGVSNREISRRIKCNEKSVRKTLQKFFATGSVNDAPKSGRPRVTTHREDRAIKIRGLRNSFETANDVRKYCNPDQKCSLSTVKNRSKEFKLRGCIARRKPMVSARNRKR